MGVGAIEPEQGLKALEQLISSGEAQVTAATVDWKQFKAVYEARGKRPKLERIEAGVKEERKEKPKLKVRDRQELRSWLQEQVGEVLGFREGQKAELEQGFFEMGMDSLLAVELKNRLGSSLGVTLNATIAFDHPNIESLTGYLMDQLGWQKKEIIKTNPRQESTEPIAIIGIACRFPGGAEDPEAFWQLMKNGVDAIGKVPEERWDRNYYYDPEAGKPGKMITQEGGFLKQVDSFDAQFFGISPREAVSMDPQQRLLLETSQEALERA